MSQELEEKVARAIGAQPAYPYHDYPERCARAALAVVREAMAEPNEDMVLKGYNALMEWDARTGEDLGMMEIWDAMPSASPLGEQ